jgi:hypothetical protein
MMNDYMPLIMGAAFVLVLSIGIKFLTGSTLHKMDKKQRNLDFDKKTEQPERGMAAGMRR